MAISHRINSIVLAICFQVASVQDQAPVAVLAPNSVVVTNSKGNPKAVHVQFQISGSVVVEQVRLSYRQFGKDKYSERELKLNHELFYEAFIPYSEKVEYYLTIKTEKGDDFTEGTSAVPRVLHTEDLHSEKEVNQHRLKKIAIVGTVIAIAVIAAIALHETIGRKSNPPPKTAGGTGF